MSGSEMRVFLRRKHAEDIIIFMNWLAIVSPLLFVPPVGIWIAELALFGRWIDVAAILLNLVNIARRSGFEQ